MYVYLKYILFMVGLYAASLSLFKSEMAPAIVSLGAFIAFAIIETRDLKTLNDDKD